jgi:hypothetical protein
MDCAVGRFNQHTACLRGLLVSAPRKLGKIRAFGLPPFVAARASHALKPSVPGRVLWATCAAKCKGIMFKGVLTSNMIYKLMYSKNKIWWHLHWKKWVRFSFSTCDHPGLQKREHNHELGKIQVQVETCVICSKLLTLGMPLMQIPWIQAPPIHPASIHTAYIKNNLFQPFFAV